jgi:hypothetical protein
VTGRVPGEAPMLDAEPATASDILTTWKGAPCHAVGSMPVGSTLLAVPYNPCPCCLAGHSERTGHRNFTLASPRLPRRRFKAVRATGAACIGMAGHRWPMAATPSALASPLCPPAHPAAAARLPLKRQVFISHTGQDGGAKMFAASILKSALAGRGYGLYLSAWGLAAGGRSSW